MKTLITIIALLTFPLLIAIVIREERKQKKRNKLNLK